MRFLVHIREEAGSEPDHVMGICLLALELRLDYMGTSAVMARISRLDAELRDEWRRERGANTVTRRLVFFLIYNIYNDIIIAHLNMILLINNILILLLLHIFYFKFI